MSRRPALVLTVLAGLCVVSLVALTALADFFVDWLWFESLGFGAVFATVWHTKVVALALAAGSAVLFLAVNGLAAVWMHGPRVRRLRVIRPHRGNGEGFPGLPEFFEFPLDSVPWKPIALVGALLFGLFIGIGQAGNWESFLKWRYAVPFGRVDPVFGHDVGFYAFTLPAAAAVREWALLTLFLAAVLAGSLYWAYGAIVVEDGFPRLSPAVVRHLSALLAIFFVIKAGDYLLQRYDLLLGSTSVVFGAGYTDVHLRAPLLAALVAVSLIGTTLCAANVVFCGFRLPVAAVVVVLAVSLIEGIVPSIFQSYRVRPDELRLESPYIATNIAWTRFGFGIDQIGAKPFPAAGKLTPEILAANAATIDNLRWWDPRPLLDTYGQLQAIRTYYDFRDVDIDRYSFNGTTQQVMLAARELNQSRLSQTWINQHFTFTHGSGVAMSPVNNFDDEGLPIFYLKDIPPVSPVGLRIDRPELYFGEETSTYVVVGGGTKEFDYPKGQENVYATYAGKGGIGLGSLWRRALFAWHFGDLKLLISENVSATSRVLMRRLIQDRISRVAPFLRLDHDPYVVVNDGRLVWLQDAYTVSDALPYSQASGRGRINYIRNAVKVATDAYDGTIVFYVADPEDPLIRTYQRIFPSLFQPLDSMPASLREHIRYPEDLFVLQATMHGTYHMGDPEVFYNKEDLWTFPQESYGGQMVTMQPYYTVMRLPGETRAEFILMLPMVPNNRDNMIAWLAARCDGAHYGAVIEYAFPKDKVIYGPKQIEARIDQDTTISQQLSLWNQIGSRVIRGNLLVVPIDDALLYVEPLYLSAEKGQLPELKRLIASTGDRVVMNQRIEPLLAALFGGETKPAPAAAEVKQTVPTAGAATEALTHYRQALAALRNGDWQTFGTEMNALQKVLEGE